MINFNRSHKFDLPTQARAEILYALAIESFIHNDMRAGFESADVPLDSTNFAYNEINCFDTDEINEWFNSISCGSTIMDISTDWLTGHPTISLISR